MAATASSVVGTNGTSGSRRSWAVCAAAAAMVRAAARAVREYLSILLLLTSTFTAREGCYSTWGWTGGGRSAVGNAVPLDLGPQRSWCLHTLTASFQVS